jgi:hypothetical protein
MEGKKANYPVDGSREFPIKSYEQLHRLQMDYSQKSIYKNLVETFGRQVTLERLGTILPPEVVSLQLRVLCPEDNLTRDKI